MPFCCTYGFRCAFGVYAATNVTYSVNSTVTFSAQVDVTWTADVRDGAGTDLADSEENESVDFVPTDTDGRSASWAPSSLSFGTGEATTDTIIYTFTCTNHGSQAVTIAAPTSQIFTEWATLIEGGDITLSVSEQLGSASADADDTTIEGGQLDGEEAVYTVIITVKLVDKTVTVPNGTLKISFTTTAAN